ncbi:MAG: mannonate dehydratase [Gemmatimonadaceae bacterium]|nr:mannonate dehydratase [Gemmatimonadaceae bacterium]
MPLSMRVGLGQFNELTDEMCQFIKQMGCDDFLMNTPKLPGDEGHWKVDDLAALKAKADAYDLRLMALENVPIPFYLDIMLGGPEKEAQLANMITTVRNMGQVGIPILGYHWIPVGVWRTQEPETLRGGARGTRFDLQAHAEAPLNFDRVYSEQQMWDNYCWYLERLLPVAERAGVRLALHPDDPPVPSLGGVARLFGTFEGFKKAMDTFDSPNHGLDFCMGCWSEMGGHDNVMRGFDAFVPDGKIVYIHFRDVRGTRECFHECFIDEGQVDTYAVVQRLKQLGFDGFMIPDHVPATVGDSGWHHRGRAHCVGFMQAMIQAVDRQGAA